jgi:hypothetical protein
VFTATTGFDGPPHAISTTVIVAASARAPCFAGSITPLSLRFAAGARSAAAT